MTTTDAYTADSNYNDPATSWLVYRPDDSALPRVFACWENAQLAADVLNLERTALADAARSTPAPTPAPLVSTLTAEQLADTLNALVRNDPNVWYVANEKAIKRLFAKGVLSAPGPQPPTMRAYDVYRNGAEVLYRTSEGDGWRTVEGNLPAWGDFDASVVVVARPTPSPLTQLAAARAEIIGWPEGSPLIAAVDAVLAAGKTG